MPTDHGQQEDDESRRCCRGRPSLRGSRGETCRVRARAGAVARAVRRANPATWRTVSPCASASLGTLRRSVLRPERVFVHVRQFPRLVIKRAVIPVVRGPVIGQVVTERSGVDETVRLAPDRVLGDERQLPRLVGGRLAVPVVDRIAARPAVPVSSATARSGAGSSRSRRPAAAR